MVYVISNISSHLQHLEITKSEGARVVLHDLNCRQDIEVLGLGHNYIKGAVWRGLKYWTNLKKLDVKWSGIDVPSLLKGNVGTFTSTKRRAVWNGFT